MNGDMEFSFEMSNEEIERIKYILTSGGLRHYLLEIADGEELDVVEYKEYQKLEKENQELKKENQEYKRLGFKHLNDKCNKLEKQLEDKEDFITKLQATKDKLDKWDRENYYQQKEFIDWLEENYKNTQDIWYIKVLNKYKEIIGVSNENNKQ